MSVTKVSWLSLVLFLIPMQFSSASTYYVATNGNGSDGSTWTNAYTTIQAAVTASINGDVIIVGSSGTGHGDGSYTENVDVDKQVTIQSESGYASTTVIAASTEDHVFYISDTGDNTNITGFTIYGATGTEKGGICLYYAENCTVANNRCGVDASHKNYIGIYLRSYSHNAAIQGNIANYNTNQGIRLDYWSSSNIISGNTCKYNGLQGILLTVGNDYNTITANTCSNNDGSGIRLYNSSDNNMVSGNTCEDNTDASGNDSGLDIDLNCTYNIVVGNTFKNSVYGVVIWEAGCQYNRCYLNDLSGNSTSNVYVASGTTNLWSSPTAMHYDYSSGSLHKNSLGNYYSNYGGSDGDSDGIGGTTYTTGGADDDYPLWQTADNYSLQAWWLHSDDKMYRSEVAKTGGSITISSSGSNIWIADQAALATRNFSGSDTWTGQVAFTSAPTNGHTFTVEIGSSTNGSDFTAGGPDVTITGNGSATVFTFTTDASAFSVSTGQYLALKITSNHAEYSLRTGGAWSYTSSPESSTDYSLPVELSFFTATAGNGQVTLEWITESELDNLGFNVYRSANKNDQFPIINNQLIPGAGTTSSRHEYEYVDNDVTNGITYWYKLEDVDYSGNTELHGPVSATPSLDQAAPQFRLYPASPNPLNPMTVIRYDLSGNGWVSITIYDLLGNQINTLVDRFQSPGSYRIEWNGFNDRGQNVSAGVYLIKLQYGNNTAVQKCLVTR